MQHNGTKDHAGLYPPLQALCFEVLQLGPATVCQGGAVQILIVFEA